MAHDLEITVKSPAEYDYKVRNAKKAMRAQVTMFMVMIFLTFVAFAAVAAGFSRYYTLPVIVLLASIQVALQLYYFMHMSEKNHGIPAMFLYTGVFFGFSFVLAFLTAVWF